jgi:glycosyltransferase involved in cell wall biosynthesis
MPTLSVIVPAYNRAKLIGESLRSLLSQTLPADEIIVVDDGSTDDTVVVAESFGPPIKVISRPNGGPAAARNTGFQASKGDFIHFFDSDDLAAANKHEVQVAALIKTGAEIAYGPWLQGRFNRELFEVNNQVLQQRGLPAEESLVRALLTYWSIVPHAALFRRSIVEKVNGFPEDLFVAEDQYMFLKCLLAGARVVHTPGTIEFYRLGDDSKITESKDGKPCRLWHWANFLIKARSACLEKAVEPLHWFGYRRRLWDVEQDLATSHDGILSSQLRSALDCRPCYQWHRKIERWRGGLQWRMTGGRAHPYFRMGRMERDQADLLQQLGYKMAYAERAPWWPQRNVERKPCVG